MSDKTMKSDDRITIGAIELIDLPDLKLEGISARVDTGAQTSSLHAENIEKITYEGTTWVQFKSASGKTIKAKIHDIRQIKSSNGTRQKRYVVETSMRLGDKQWPIELTLTDRSDMNFEMLLGREGMAGKVLVNPEESYLIAK